MILLESDFQSLFSPWMTDPANAFTCAYELKISNGNTVSWGKFRDQQIPSLCETYYGVKHHKLTDASVGLKPYDGYCMKGEDAYVGIMFNIPVNQKIFYLIHIKEVMKIKNSGAKSITKKDCERVGIKKSF